MAPKQYSNHTLISSLRSKGYRISIKHIRNKYESKVETVEKNGIKMNFMVENPSAKGGKTQVLIEKNGSIFGGEARCRSNEIFCKKEGVSIALSRAISLMGETT